MMHLLNKIILTTVLVSGFVCGQTSYSGLNAWYHVNAMAQSGGGGSFFESVRPSINPASIAGQSRAVETSMIRYPANIGAESFMVIIPAKHQTYGFEIRHIGYGIFKGYDEQGIKTTDYSANDAWVIATLASKARQNKLLWGISGGIFRSQIETYLSYVLTASAGMIYSMPGSGLSFSTSVQNIGAVLRSYSKNDERLPGAVYSGISKKLKYLPLQVGVDIGVKNASRSLIAVISAVVYATPEFNIYGGVSTSRFDQSSSRVLSNYFSAAGIGASYANKGIVIKTGTHFIGPGGWVIGVGIGMKF